MTFLFERKVSEVATTNAADQPDAWVTGIQEGYRTKTIRVGNCTVHIHRPILEPAEQAKREDEVRRAILALTT